MKQFVDVHDLVDFAAGWEDDDGVLTDRMKGMTTEEAARFLLDQGFDPHDDAERGHAVGFVYDPRHDRFVWFGSVILWNDDGTEVRELPWVELDILTGRIVRKDANGNEPLDDAEARLNRVGPSVLARLAARVDDELGEKVASAASVEDAVAVIREAGVQFDQWEDHDLGVAVSIDPFEAEALTDIDPAVSDGPAWARRDLLTGEVTIVGEW
jgi:hypothetical protein